MFCLWISGPPPILMLLLIPQLFAYIEWTISAGHNIADMRLIYSLQYTERCCYRKINVPLVVLWGWTGCTHICSHNTTADLAVREWASERGCGETADSVVYQSFIKPLCCHRRVTSDCGSVSYPGCTPAEKNLSVCKESMIKVID